MIRLGGDALIRQRVMALPAGERLDFALELLDAVTGQTENAIVFLRQKFRLSRTEAMLLAMLNAAYPRFQRKEALFVGVWGHDAEANIKVLDVYICKLRKKIGFDLIRTAWGEGYALAQPIEVPVMDVPPRFERIMNKGRGWSQDDDATLRRMMENGSDLWAIAEDLDRSERACLDRWRVLRRGVAA